MNRRLGRPPYLRRVAELLFELAHPGNLLRRQPGLFPVKNHTSFKVSVLGRKIQPGERLKELAVPIVRSFHEKPRKPHLARRFSLGSARASKHPKG